MIDQDIQSDIVDQVAVLCANESPIRIVGNNTKNFLGASSEGIELNVADHRGIVSYQPTELVFKARCGTRINDIVATLAAEGQMLAFEPPVFSGSDRTSNPHSDTLGGVIACGLSGPRRPYAGAARDFVLGMGIINGKAEPLKFGGEVMKNVAGYDVSRLQVGAMGTLGVILDVALKVLPMPEKEITLLFENDSENDVSRLISLARLPLPVSASAVSGHQQWIRLSGCAPSVVAAAEMIGGSPVEPESEPWENLRTHRHPFFKSVSDSDQGSGQDSGQDSAKSIWRISVADYAPPLKLPGEWLIEWGGALRWLKTDAPASQVFSVCKKAKGHATHYYGKKPEGACSQPLEGTIRKLHAAVRHSFDPAELFNPGRYHPEIQA